MYIKELKFSLWADFIEREFITDGLIKLIDSGVVNGATSNPAIFKNAILTSSAYKDQLAKLSHLNVKQKYEAVAIYDIQAAADILRPLYDMGNDGFVSIEVDPFLCDDATATVAEGKRLFEEINRPNVMIKVPATKAGFIAMQELSGSSIPVNATLIFSKEQALSCAKAFTKGREVAQFAVKTVISVFVSRIDRALDVELAQKGIDIALSGVYNAAAIYAAVEKENVEGCRTLFASTGVKGNELIPSYYIDQLLAYNSVNTAPLDTIDAFVKHGDIEAKLPISEDLIAAHFDKLENAGIDFNKIIQAQIDDGLEAFKVAFQEILDALE